MEPILGVHTNQVSPAVPRRDTGIVIVNGIPMTAGLMITGAARNASWFPRNINAPYPRFTTAIPMPANDTTIAYDERNQEVLASNQLTAPMFSNKTSNTALPNGTVANLV